MLFPPGTYLPYSVHLKSNVGNQGWLPKGREEIPDQEAQRLALWPAALWMYLPAAIPVAVQCLRDNRVCPDPAHLFIDVLAKIGHVEDAAPILEACISQVFSKIFKDR